MHRNLAVPWRAHSQSPYVEVKAIDVHHIHHPLHDLRQKVHSNKGCYSFE